VGRIMEREKMTRRLTTNSSDLMDLIQSAQYDGWACVALIDIHSYVYPKTLRGL